MFHYIDKLRDKPVATRRKYALVLSSTVFAIMLIVWILNAPYMFNQNQQTVATETTPSPVESLTANIFSTVNSIKEIIARKPITTPIPAPKTSTTSENSRVIIIDK